MKKYIAEGIGTFFLVFGYVLATNNGDIALMAPLVTGLALTAMTYAGAHVSGAHFNPAVTLAALMRGRMERNEAFYYPVAQAAGALLAALLGGFLLRCGLGADTHMFVHKNWICSMLAEFAGTFAWVYVALLVASAKNAAGHANSGLAIGSVVAATGYLLGGVSGGLFNPATVLGAIVTGMSSPADIPVFLVGDLLGAAAAATAYQLVQGNEG